VEIKYGTKMLQITKKEVNRNSNKDILKRETMMYFLKKAKNRV
jgi:hypothetical protein